MLSRNKVAFYLMEQDQGNWGQWGGWWLHVVIFVVHSFQRTIRSSIQDSYWYSEKVMYFVVFWYCETRWPFG